MASSPSGVWLWVTEVFRCAYYVVSQFSCRLLWSNKASEQSWYVAAIAAWHTSEKCQQSGADKVGVNSWLTQSPFLKFYLCVHSPSLSFSPLLFCCIFCLSYYSLFFPIFHCKIWNLQGHYTVEQTDNKQNVSFLGVIIGIVCQCLGCWKQSKLCTPSAWYRPYFYPGYAPGQDDAACAELATLCVLVCVCVTSSF